MEKFLNFRWLVLISATFFCVKHDKNKKAFFLKFYAHSFGIEDDNGQKWKTKWKNKKRNVGRNFEKMTIICAISVKWRKIRIIWFFLVIFHRIFFLFFFVWFLDHNDYYVMERWEMTFSLRMVPFFFHGRAHKKISHWLRRTIENAEISPSLTPCYMLVALFFFSQKKFWGKVLTQIKTLCMVII